MASEGGKIDPMHQFMIEPIAPLNLAGYDISFTNSSLFMLIVLGTIWLFMLGGMKRDLVPGRWQAAVEGVTGLKMIPISGAGESFLFDWQPVKQNRQLQINIRNKL